MKNLISIIVPIYNCYDYIDRCMESITNQTYKNLQIILVDDGSNDNSASKCRFWVNYDSRVEYYHKSNNGVSSARNFGLTKVKGQYISFVDSDDWLSLEMYQKMLNIMFENDCNLVICGRTRVLSDGNIISYPHTGIHFFSDTSIDMSKLSCQYDLSICMNKLYRANIWKELRFPENMSYAEDLYIVPDIILNAKKIVYISESLYFYYERLNSASFCLNEEKLESDIIAKYKFYAFLRDRNVYDLIAFNWLFGAYVRGYDLAKNKYMFFHSEYVKFFTNNISKCIFKLKCILFLLYPKVYLTIKNKHN